MGRRLITYTVTDENRDKGKSFVIKEMSASQAESWAARAFMALLASGATIPDNIAAAGMAGMAELGIKALGGLKWEDAKPLLNEMMDCVQYMPDLTKPQLLRPLFEEDIEEVSTRLKIRTEVWKLHTDFFQAGNRSVSPEPQMERRQTQRDIRISRK